MKLMIGGKSRDMRAVWWQSGRLRMIDQRLLPFKLKIFTSRKLSDAEFAIKDMVVRGAPAIGAAAAYAMAQEKLSSGDMKKACIRLKATRPTAYDLFHAVDWMAQEIAKGADPVESAERYTNDIVEECRLIGVIGERLIKKQARIMTHCNAGALATVDYGTALAPIREAHKRGKNPYVFVSETRPRLQGAKLTSFELKSEGISHAIIPDGSSGHFLSRGQVDIVITGADRITLQGDAANKIGTYEKAVIAKENGVPFYIAAPLSSFDLTMKSGKSIVIEERSEDEVLFINGKPIAAPGVKARNPAFDVTPAKYITGIITRYGILKPSDIKNKLLKRKK